MALADAAQISATLVDMIRAVSVREIRSIAERLLVRLPGRNKGGLFVSIAPGQPPTVPISSLADAITAAQLGNARDHRQRIVEARRAAKIDLRPAYREDDTLLLP